MAIRRVFIWDTQQDIDVSEAAGASWIAQGDYRGERIIAHGVDELSAVRKWVALARALGGPNEW